MTKFISVKHEEPYDQGLENTKERFSREIRTLIGPTLHTKPKKRTFSLSFVAGIILIRMVIFI